MNDSTRNGIHSVYFVQLVMSLFNSAMMMMGKVPNPITGEVERSLDDAEHAIETLAMLQAKTAGNLSTEEKRLLETQLTNLRLTFVREAERRDADEGDAGGDAAESGAEDRPSGSGESDGGDEAAPEGPTPAE